MSCHYVVGFEALQGTGRRENRLPFRKLNQAFAKEVNAGQIRFDTGSHGNMFVRYNMASTMSDEDQAKLKSLGVDKISGPFPQY
jgi:hypothetical protein